MDKMFGFIFQQPIHKTLRQMRVATIVLLFVSVDIMYRLLNILERDGEMSSTQTTGAIATLTAAVFAAIWKGICNLSDAQKNDD